jgi:hypothetical protein
MERRRFASEGPGIKFPTCGTFDRAWKVEPRPLLLKELSPIWDNSFQIAQVQAPPAALLGYPRQWMMLPPTPNSALLASVLPDPYPLAVPYWYRQWIASGELLLIIVFSMTWKAAA